MRVVADDLEVRLGGRVVLEDVTVSFDGPGLVQIMGPNGAGKTTLLRTLAGLVKPVRGRVIVEHDGSRVDVTGKPGEAGKFIGYTPQLAPALAAGGLPLTALELVEYSIRLRRKRWPRLTSFSAEAARALEAVGLSPDVARKPLSELSGGQLQRVLIARALALNKPVLVMDEPMAAVDPAGRGELARLLASLSRERLVIVTSHDPMLLLPYTSRIVLLNGRVVAEGPPDRVLAPEVLREVYGDSVIVVERHAHVSDSHWGGRP